MKVSRKDWLYWGTLAIIAFFFLEFFWPMMYSQEQAVPTPSPETPTTFTGSAIVQAKIMYFSDEAYVFCNSSKANFIKSLESVSGTYKHNGPWASDDFSLCVNATNETQTNATWSQLASLVDSECGSGSTVLRKAGLSLDQDINFQSDTSLNGSLTFDSTNRSQLISAYTTTATPRCAQQSSGNLEGFVEINTQINASVPVSMAITTSGNQIAFKRNIEQLRFTKPFAQ